MQIKNISYPLFLPVSLSVGSLAEMQLPKYDIKPSSLVLYERFFTNNIDEGSLFPLLPPSGVRPSRPKIASFN